MRIRTKLLLLVTVLTVAMLVNLLALSLLARTVITSLTTVEEAGLRQQIVALQMQAALRDAEAALYRYQIEGEAGFASQFQQQLENFRQGITTYENLATSEAERAWAGELARAHQNAVMLGTNLMLLRDQQTSDLQALEELNTSTTALLAGPIRSERLNDLAYQETVDGMRSALREMLLAVTAYLSAPQETERVRFTEAAVSFRQHYNELQTLAPDSEALKPLLADFAQIQFLGSRLISRLDQQQAQFANFAAMLFRIGEEVIVGEIQPHAAQKLSQAQTELSNALNLSLTVTLLVAVTGSVIAVVITFPLLRQMDSGILALLRGADRVAEGNLQEPVPETGGSEFERLGHAFNKMMHDLALRERRLEARLSELEALRQVSLQLTSTLELTRVLDTIAASALQLVRAAQVHIFLCDESGANPRFGASAWSDHKGAQGPRLPRADGLVVTAARIGTLQVVNGAADHPLFSSPEARTWGIEAAAAIPLKPGKHVQGVFNVSLDDRPAFNDDELRILGLLADQAAVALENARLYQSVADKEARLQVLINKLAHVQEEERRLVGLDLHDGLTQVLLSANMHLNTFASLISEGLQDSDSASRELARVRARLQEAIEEVRWVVSELRPTEVDDFGLVDGLRHYVTRVAQLEQWRLVFSADLQEKRLAPAVENAIFRIVQEALSNARKYATTDRIRVSLKTRDEQLWLEVRDWGTGFAPDDLTDENKSLGLVGMKERAAVLGGELEIETRPGKGTTIRMCVPLARVCEEAQS